MDRVWAQQIFVLYFAGHLPGGPSNRCRALYYTLFAYAQDAHGDRHHLVLEHSLDANVVDLFRISRGKRVIGTRQLWGSVENMQN